MRGRHRDSRHRPKKNSGEPPPTRSRVRPGKAGKSATKRHGKPEKRRWRPYLRRWSGWRKSPGTRRKQHFSARPAGVPPIAVSGRCFPGHSVPIAGRRKRGNRNFPSATEVRLPFWKTIRMPTHRCACVTMPAEANFPGRRPYCWPKDARFAPGGNGRMPVPGPDEKRGKKSSWRYFRSLNGWDTLMQERRFRDTESPMPFAAVAAAKSGGPRPAVFCRGATISAAAVVKRKLRQFLNRKCGP